VGRYKERVNKGEYGEYILYLCMKYENIRMKPIEVVLRREVRGEEG
jgi:hypothetical protein